MYEMAFFAKFVPCIGWIMLWFASAFISHINTDANAAVSSLYEYNREQNLLLFSETWGESTSILNACYLLPFVVERKNEGAVVEHPVCGTGPRGQYVSNKEDSRPGCKRHPRGIKRRTLATLLRYCITSLIYLFWELSLAIFIADWFH